MSDFFHMRNWYIITLLRSYELRHDLRAYKFEKKHITRRNEPPEVEPVVEDKSPRGRLKKTIKVIPKSYQKAKKKLATRPIDSGIFRNVVSEGTAENFFIKSAFGFFGGIILVYICYLFLIYSLNFTLRRATFICVVLGVILSLGLAFSVRTRCTVLLCIPQLFSKRGRQALLAYAFILALSGPAKNTLHNIEVMSESLACGQEQLKKAENELLKCVYRPNTALKQPLELMIVNLDIAVKKFKNFVEKFYRDCEAVIETIIQAQEWLYSIYWLCSRKMGNPYTRCTELLYEASANCKATSEAPDWQRACDVSTVKDVICPTKPDPVCKVEDLPPLWPSLLHQKELNEFRKEALNLIQVQLEAHQIFSEPNRTSTLREEYQGMATEIRQKTDKFLQYFDVMSVIFGIFILVLFIKVLIYRYKFLTEDQYDNRFITSDFIDIDRTRAEFGMQTLLPLEPREKKKYIRVVSLRMVSIERKRVVSSFVFLIFATFKIVIHMLIDCSLYWMLSMMRRHGRMLLVVSEADSPQVTIWVSGEGLFAELLRNITRTVKPYAFHPILDPVPCLPDPISPDWNRYLQILSLVLICWFLACCEPYGLRLRHIVMVTYHPDRARERAIWLYNRILTTRINYVKFARRQLRRKYKNMDKERFFRKRFGIWRRPLRCLLCKVKLKGMDYYKCPTPTCVGIYCRKCFSILKVCSICTDPRKYGDPSDVSEEKDSEPDEIKCTCKKCTCLVCKCHKVETCFQRKKKRLIAQITTTGKCLYPKTREAFYRLRYLRYRTRDRPCPPDGPMITRVLNKPIVKKVINRSKRVLTKCKSPRKRDQCYRWHLPSVRLCKCLRSCPTWKLCVCKKMPRVRFCLPSKIAQWTVCKPSNVSIWKWWKTRTLNNLRVFRWKLRESIFERKLCVHSPRFRERFKNVYFVDLKKYRSGAKWREICSSAENFQHENVSKGSTPVSIPLTSRSRRSERSSETGSVEQCPLHGSRKSSTYSSYQARTESNRSDEEDNSSGELKDKETQAEDSGGSSDQMMFPTSGRRSSDNFRSERSSARSEVSRQTGRKPSRRRVTSSESSQEGKRPIKWKRARGKSHEAPPRKSLARKVGTMKNKLSKFFRRPGKKQAMDAGSEECLTSDREDGQFLQSDEELDRKSTRPDLLSDLPSSKMSSYRDLDEDDN